MYMIVLLASLLVALLENGVQAVVVYKEEVLYMMQKDIKVIRLRDFLQGGIMTSYTLEFVDPLNSTYNTNNTTGNNTTNGTANTTGNGTFNNSTLMPPETEIFPSKSPLYRISNVYGNNTTDIIDINLALDVKVGLENFYLFRLESTFVLAEIIKGAKPEESTAKATAIVMNTAGEHSYSKPLNMFVTDAHYFTLWEEQPVIGANASNGISLIYHYLDPSNSVPFSLRAQKLFRNVDIGSPSSYQYTVYMKNSYNHRLLASLPAISNTRYHFFQCNTEFLDAAPARWNMDCKMMTLNLTFPKDLEGKLSLETTSYDNETNIRMVLKNKVTQNLFYYTICEERGTAFVCSNITQITTTKIMENTLNRVVNLGGGHIGILTQYFLMYSVDLQYTRFERIHTPINISYVNSTDPNTIPFSRKFSKYISIAFASRDLTPFSRQLVGGPEYLIRSFVIIEYELQVPEIYRDDVGIYRYFRQHDNNLFVSVPLPPAGPPYKSMHEGTQFIDAHVSFRGSIVEAKQGFNPNAIMDTLKFVVKAFSGGQMIGQKEFQVILVQKPMDAMELKIPFNEVRLIKGGIMSILLKDDYIIGNDIQLTLYESTGQIKTKIQKPIVYNVTLQGTRFDKSTEKLKTMIMLYDNIVLLADQDAAEICFLKGNYSDSNVVKGMISGVATCKNQVSLPISSFTEIVFAQILNIHHLLVVTKSETFVSPNYKHTAKIFNIDPNFVGASRTISADIPFLTPQFNKTVVAYTYATSAWIFNIQKNLGSKTTLFLTKIIKQPNDTYTHQVVNVSYDANRYTDFEELVPDHITSHIFYMMVTETGSIKNTYMATVNERMNGSVVVEAMLSFQKKLSNRNGIVPGNEYCTVKQELISIGKESNSNDTKQRIFAIPFAAKYSVHEKMQRRMPLDSAGLESVIMIDCMEERNSMIVAAKKINSTGVLIINYDFDMVHDPRRRIEGIIDIPGLNTNGLLLSAKAKSFQFTDYIFVSNMVNKTTRNFWYVEQPAKQIKFEMDCPPNFNDGFKIVMNLNLPHSQTNMSMNKSLGVLVKPLDYSTQITVHNVAKLPKKVGIYNLENDTSPLLNIRGHFYNAQLVNFSDINKKDTLVGDKSPVVLENRLAVQEDIESNGTVEVRIVDEIIVARLTSGDIKIFNDPKNRSNFLQLHLNAKSMDANSMPTELSTNKSLLLMVGEEVRNGLIVSFHQMPTAASINATTAQRFSTLVEGVYTNMMYEICGNNMYVIMESKQANSLFFASIEMNKDGFTKPSFRNNLTMKLESEYASSDFICLKDSQNKNDSLGILILYKNQTHALYSFRDQFDVTAMQVVDIPFMRQKNIFVADVECELVTTTYNATTYLYSTLLKCFYATRWADDYVVSYMFEKGVNTFSVKDMRIVRELEEVKDFDPLKTLAEEDHVLVVGENLRDPPHNRSYYIMYYEWTLEKTYIKSFLKIDRTLNYDPEFFKQMIHLNQNGSIVLLAKNPNNPDTNAYDRIVRYNVTGLRLNIKSVDFDPSKIFLDILSIGGEKMERINLMNLFNLDGELNDIRSHPFTKVFVLMFVGSVVLLLGALIFYGLSNRLYNKSRQMAQSNTRLKDLQRKMTRRKFVSSSDMQLNDEDSDEFMDDIAKGNLDLAKST